MKKYILLSGALLIISTFGLWTYWEHGKIEYGIITYQTNFSSNKIVSLVEEIDNALSEKEMAFFVNKESKLFFNEKSSKWYQLKVNSIEEKPNEGRKSGVESYVFNDFQVGSSVEIQKISDIVMYSYPDTIKGITYIETGNYFKVLSYNCKEIIMLDRAKVPSLRFLVAVKIPYPIGPSIYGYQKGAILRVDDLLDGGEILFEAIRIEKTSTKEILKTRPKLNNMYSKKELLEMAST